MKSVEKTDKLTQIVLIANQFPTNRFKKLIFFNVLNKFLLKHLEY